MPSQPFLAMIIPVGTSPPGGGGSPPGFWGPPGPWPTPPIHMPPGQPPVSGAHPEHPIYYPPGIWGPTDPRPGYWVPGAPGAPGAGGRPPGTWGGAGEPFPTPPIVIPPQQPGQPPLVIWGPNDPRPTPPIEIPGQPTPPPGGDRVQLVEWKTAWTPQTGWIVVGLPQAPHPAPA